jgi:hypothetical protein
MCIIRGYRHRVLLRAREITVRFFKNAGVGGRPDPLRQSGQCESRKKDHHASVRGVLQVAGMGGLKKVAGTINNAREIGGRPGEPACYRQVDWCNTA